MIPPPPLCCRSGEGKLLPQFVLLLLVQLVNLVCQAYSMRRFRSLARQEQLLQVRCGAVRWACLCPPPPNLPFPSPRHALPCDCIRTSSLMHTHALSPLHTLPP